MSKLAKAKRFKLSPGHGHSLHVTASASVTAKGAARAVGGVEQPAATHEFHGFAEREACFKTICAQCLAANGRVPAVAE